MSKELIDKHKDIPIFLRMISMNKVSLGSTSKRGSGEIDHIFSSLEPNFSYKDDFLINNNISDHSIIGY